MIIPEKLLAEAEKEQLTETLQVIKSKQLTTLAVMQNYALGTVLYILMDLL